MNSKLLLLQLLFELRSIHEDPNVTKQLEDAYKLNAEEQKKWMEAKTLIASADKLREEFKAHSVKLDAQAAKIHIDTTALTARENALIAATNVHHGQKEQLAHELASHLEAVAKHDTNVKGNMMFKDELVAMRAKLDDRATALDAREHELDEEDKRLKAWQAKVKATAMAVQKQTENL